MEQPTASSSGGTAAAARSGPPASVWLRPIGTPMPLGLFGLAAASLVVSGLELGWIAPSQRLLVGIVLVSFPVVIQLVASVLSFLARDGATGSALGVLAVTWLTTGAVFILSPRPGSTSGALGLLLLVAAAAVLLSGAVGALSKLLPALVLALVAARFAASGVYELSANGSWQDVAGAIGLGVTALALYTASALELEGVKSRTVLPLARRGPGELALEGSLREQLEDVKSEAGVRKIL